MPVLSSSLISDVTYARRSPLLSSLLGVQGDPYVLHLLHPPGQFTGDGLFCVLDQLVNVFLVWLRNLAVSADNNEAERALRPAVVTRKTSFGSRSKRGAQDFARLLSLIQTWARQGKDFFTTARAALNGDLSQN